MTENNPISGRHRKQISNLSKINNFFGTFVEVSSDNTQKLLTPSELNRKLRGGSQKKVPEEIAPIPHAETETNEEVSRYLEQLPASISPLITDQLSKQEEPPKTPKRNALKIIKERKYALSRLWRRGTLPAEETPPVHTGEEERLQEDKSTVQQQPMLSAVDGSWKQPQEFRGQQQLNYPSVNIPQQRNNLAEETALPTERRGRHAKILQKDTELVEDLNKEPERHAKPVQALVEQPQIHGSQTNGARAFLDRYKMIKIEREKRNSKEPLSGEELQQQAELFLQQAVNERGKVPNGVQSINADLALAEAYAHAEQHNASTALFTVVENEIIDGYGTTMTIPFRNLIAARMRLGQIDQADSFLTESTELIAALPLEKIDEGSYNLARAFCARGDIAKAEAAIAVMTTGEASEKMKARVKADILQLKMEQGSMSTHDIEIRAEVKDFPITLTDYVAQTWTALMLAAADGKKGHFDLRDEILGSLDLQKVTGKIISIGSGKTMQGEIAKIYAGLGYTEQTLAFIHEQFPQEAYAEKTTALASVATTLFEQRKTLDEGVTPQSSSAPIMLFDQQTRAQIRDGNSPFRGGQDLNGGQKFI